MSRRHAFSFFFGLSFSLELLGRGIRRVDFFRILSSICALCIVYFCETIYPVFAGGGVQNHALVRQLEQVQVQCHCVCVV